MTISEIASNPGVRRWFEHENTAKKRLFDFLHAHHQSMSGAPHIYQCNVILQ
jgi:hypothetical protein